jgi:hypothetical protein
MPRARLMQILAVFVLMALWVPAVPAAADGIRDVVAPPPVVLEQARADLVVDISSTLSPIRLQCGGTATSPLYCRVFVLGFTVRNVGGAGSPATKLAVAATRYNVPALAPGASAAVAGQTRFVPTGTCISVSALVDPDNLVYGDVDSNNTTTISICA